MREKRLLSSHTGVLGILGVHRIRILKRKVSRVGGKSPRQRRNQQEAARPIVLWASEGSGL